MSLLLLVLPAAGAALLDLTVFPNVRLLGSHPSLSVALIAAWATLRRREEAMVLVPMTGLLLGLLGNEPLGASVLGLAPVVLLTSRHHPEATEGRFASALTVAFLGAAAYVVILAVVQGFAQRIAPPLGGTVRQMLGGGVLTALLTGVVYFPMVRLAWRPHVPGQFRRY